MVCFFKKVCDRTAHTELAAPCGTPSKNDICKIAGCTVNHLSIVFFCLELPGATTWAGRGLCGFCTIITDDSAAGMSLLVLSRERGRELRGRAG